MTKWSKASLWHKMSWSRCHQFESWSNHSLWWIVFLFKSYVSTQLHQSVVPFVMISWNDTHCAKTATIHKVTSTLVTSKNVLFPVHNHLLSGCWPPVLLTWHFHYRLSTGFFCAVTCINKLHGWTSLHCCWHDSHLLFPFIIWCEFQASSCQILHGWVIFRIKFLRRKWYIPTCLVWPLHCKNCEGQTKQVGIYHFIPKTWSHQMVKWNNMEQSQSCQQHAISIVYSANKIFQVNIRYSYQSLSVIHGCNPIQLQGSCMLW